MRVTDGKYYYGIEWELGGRKLEQNGTYLEEILYARGGDSYFLIVRRGTKTPSWKIFGTKSINWSRSIKTLSEEEANDWAKKYLDTDVYNDIFAGSKR